MIHAIDPGLANTAIVSWAELHHGRIIAAETFTTKGAGHRVDPAKALERCATIAGQVCELVSDGDTVVMEAYEDIPGGTFRNEQRNAANRWTTPMLIGYLVHALEAQGCTVVMQSPSVVMKAYAGYKARWAQGGRGLLRGDEVLGHPENARKTGNDHERSAACHLARYLDTQWHCYIDAASTVERIERMRRQGYSKEWVAEQIGLSSGGALPRIDFRQRRGGDRA